MTELLQPGGRWRNWGRSAAAQPAFGARPASIEQVAAVIADARGRGLAVKALGSGHSFTSIAATSGVHVSLDALSGVLAVHGRRVTLGAGTKLHDLPAMLDPLGLALTNMGDIDRQSIAGATSTGTHGTGALFGGLATQIVALTLVTADGSVLHLDESSPLFLAARLGLGALGIVVDITIECVPSFSLHAVEKPEPLDEVLDNFEERATAVDHFEFYWFPHTTTALTKTNSRVPADTPPQRQSRLAAWVDDELLTNGVFALTCGIGRVAPSVVPGINRLAEKLVAQREITDVSHRVFVADRRVRFREMEYAIPRAAVPEALRAIQRLIETRGWRVSFPIEVRVAAPDPTWLSTAHDRESGYIAVHRYYREDPTEYFEAVEAIMRSLGGRPHWGKMHFHNAQSLRELYPRFDDFLAVRDELDPERVFANEYLRRVLGA